MALGDRKRTLGGPNSMREDQSLARQVKSFERALNECSREAKRLTLAVQVLSASKKTLCRTANSHSSCIAFRPCPGTRFAMKRIDILLPVTG